MTGDMLVTLVVAVNSDAQVYDTLPEVLEALPFVESVNFIGLEANPEEEDQGKEQHE